MSKTIIIDTKPHLFWINNQVVAKYLPTFCDERSDEMMKEYYEIPCYDSSANPGECFGYYKKRRDRDSKFRSWNWIEYTEIDYPKEFYLSLVLMGFNMNWNKYGFI